MNEMISPIYYLFIKSIEIQTCIACTPIHCVLVAVYYGMDTSAEVDVCLSRIDMDWVPWLPVDALLS